MIKANPGALMVKLADINDNLQEWRLTYLPAETQERLREKYRKAKVLLGVWSEIEGMPGLYMDHEELMRGK